MVATQKCAQFREWRMIQSYKNFSNSSWLPPPWLGILPALSSLASLRVPVPFTPGIPLCPPHSIRSRFHFYFLLFEYFRCHLI